MFTSKEAAEPATGTAKCAGNLASEFPEHPQEANEVKPAAPTTAEYSEPDMRKS